VSHFAALGELAAARHVPLSVLFEVTYRCNLACRHCYLPEGPADRPRPPGGELTLEEIDRILGELADAGTFTVTFTGGEVFLRRDFLEIVAAARRRELCVVVFTTGTVMTAAHAERLAALRPFAVEASVYSRRPEVHDAVTGVPGSHRRTLEALRRLRAAGVRVVIKSPLMTLNAGEYHGLIALAEELGADWGFDPVLIPRRDGDRTPLAFALSAAQVGTLARDPVLGRLFPGGATGAGSGCGDEGLCAAGRSTCRIDPYGDVFACLVSTHPVGNLRAQRFAELWQGAPYLHRLRGLRRRDLRLDPARPAAGAYRCSALAEQEDGDLLGPFRRGEALAEAVRRARAGAGEADACTA